MGRIIYAKAKMSGNGMKMMTYTGKGAFGTIEPSTLTKFKFGGEGISHGIIPFVGEGVSERPKNISQRVRKML
jgi:hypothetical protein